MLIRLVSLQVQKQMAREYEQLKATVATLQMFQHEGEKAITPLSGSEYIYLVRGLPIRLVSRGFAHACGIGLA
jgi:hypothetical protein